VEALPTAPCAIVYERDGPLGSYFLGSVDLSFLSFDSGNFSGPMHANM